MMKQYIHTDVELTEESKAALRVEADSSALLESRIAALESTVERQTRLIRDMQAMIQYLQFSR